MLNSKVNFDFSILKKLWDLAHEKLVNILGGHHVGTNIHGWQPYLKIAIYVLKSANGGLLCRPLYNSSQKVCVCGGLWSNLGEYAPRLAGEISPFKIAFIKPIETKSGLSMNCTLWTEICLTMTENMIGKDLAKNTFLNVLICQN